MPTLAQIVDAIEVIVGVVRNIALKRALAEVEPDPHLNFWRVMHGNAMDMAVLEWCKLFGLDGDVQSVHWKAWAAAGLMDTWLRWKIEPEVVYGNKTAFQPGVQGRGSQAGDRTGRVNRAGCS